MLTDSFTYDFTDFQNVFQSAAFFLIIKNDPSQNDCLSVHFSHEIKAYCLFESWPLFTDKSTGIRSMRRHSFNAF